MMPSKLFIEKYALISAVHMPHVHQNKWKPFNSHKCQMALIDFTLSNARQFYSPMGNPSEVTGLRGERFFIDQDFDSLDINLLFWC